MAVQDWCPGWGWCVGCRLKDAGETTGVLARPMGLECPAESQFMPTVGSQGALMGPQCLGQDLSPEQDHGIGEVSR